MHGAETEPPQLLTEFHSERVSQASMVLIVVPALVSTLENGSVAEGAGSGEDVRSGQRVDEQEEEKKRLRIHGRVLGASFSEGSRVPGGDRGCESQARSTSPRGCGRSQSQCTSDYE
jgi:hypothetical protein